MLTVFLVTTILSPYALFSFVAPFLQWTDHRRKSAVQHANECSAAVLLGISLYYVGGYTESFHWVMPIIASGSCIAYGFAGEYHALQTSLLYIQAWKWQMWTVMAAAIGLIVGFMVLHVRYAIQRWGRLVGLGGYLTSFLLMPLMLAMLLWALSMSQKESDAMQDYDFDLAREESGAILPPMDEEDEREHTADDHDELDSLRDLPPAPIPLDDVLRPKKQLRLHLHHYQIFAYLALFTRFPTLFSRISAGVVIGCMMHGIAAYGVDSIFEFVEATG